MPQRRLFVIVDETDLSRVGFQKYPRRTGAMVCIERAGIESAVSRIDDPDKVAFSWKEIQARLRPWQTIFELIKEDSPVAANEAELVTLWINPGIIPDIGPTALLHCWAILDERAVLTHDAGPTDGFDQTRMTPYRLVRITNEPEVIETATAEI